MTITHQNSSLAVRTGNSPSDNPLNADDINLTTRSFWVSNVRFFTVTFSEITRFSGMAKNIVIEGSMVWLDPPNERINSVMTLNPVNIIAFITRAGATMPIPFGFLSNKFTPVIVPEGDCLGHTVAMITVGSLRKAPVSFMLNCRDVQINALDCISLIVSCAKEVYVEGIVNFRYNIDTNA